MIPMTTRIAQLSLEASRLGLIDLAIGVPVFPDLQGVDEEAGRCIDEAVCGYSAARGIPALEVEILKLYEADDAMERAAVVTCGATEAIALSILSLSRPGDAVGYFEPGYPGYRDQIELLGRLPVALRMPRRLDRQWTELALQPERPSLFIVNSPANPTGRIVASSELNELLSQMAPTGSVILDEVYSPFARSGRLVSDIVVDPELQSSLVRVHSVSKLFGRPGWRVGWAVACEEVVVLLSSVHTAISVCAPTPLQYGVLTGLLAGNKANLERTWAHQERVHLFCDRLREVGWAVEQPEAGFYLRLASNEFSTSLELHAWLRDHCGVQTVPWSFFGQESGEDGPSVRVSVVGEDAVLDRAVHQMAVSHTQRSGQDHE